MKMTELLEEKCHYCGDILEKQHIYERRIQVEDIFNQYKQIYLFCSFNCMLNNFEKELKEITDITRSEEHERFKKEVLECIIKTITDFRYKDEFDEHTRTTNITCILLISKIRAEIEKM